MRQLLSERKRKFRAKKIISFSKCCYASKWNHFSFQQKITGCILNYRMEKWNYCLHCVCVILHNNHLMPNLEWKMNFIDLFFSNISWFIFFIFIMVFGVYPSNASLFPLSFSVLSHMRIYLFRSRGEGSIEIEIEIYHQHNLTLHPPKRMTFRRERSNILCFTTETQSNKIKTQRA